MRLTILAFWIAGVLAFCQLAPSKSFALLGAEVGGLLGYSFGSGSNTTYSGLGFGGRAAYHVNSTWEIGGSYALYTTSTVVTLLPPLPSQTFSTTYSFAMLDFNYHLKSLNSLYLGAMTGLQTTGLGGVYASYLALGARAGYDFDLGNGIYVGPAAHFVLGFSTPGISHVLAFASLKYRF